jgi:hypothetical protein
VVAWGSNGGNCLREKKSVALPGRRRSSQVVGIECV